MNGAFWVVAGVLGKHECWEWSNYRDADGYGRMGVCGIVKAAHRASYEAFVGEIPEGLQVDHICRNRACVNPRHLELVTFGENMRRSGPAQKTHCVNGHPYSEANTYVRPNGHRDCRACVRARAARYQLSKRNEAA